MVDGLGLSGYFDRVVGGDTVNALKPDPSPLHHVMQSLEIPPDRTLMIGDSTGDILAARQAGSRSCAVTYGFRERQALVAVEPDFIIDDIRDLVPFCQ